MKDWINLLINAKINNSQYGFRNKMCTTHALINLVEEISSSLDAKKFSIGVFKRKLLIQLAMQC